MNKSAPFTRVLAVCVLLLSLCGSSLPAFAAASPPTNDEIAQAIPLQLAPNTTRENTTGATFNAATDTVDCPGGATVWFRMRSTQARTVRLSTVGSNYDTILSVYSGKPGALTSVACNDDAVGVQSAVEVSLAANVTYYVEISTCCSAEAFGGRAVLNVLTFNRLRTSTTGVSGSAGRVSGRAFISVAQTCSHPSSLIVGATLSQRVGQFVARGRSNHFAPFCDPNGHYVLTFDSDTGVAFRSGAAALTLNTTALDGFQAASTPTLAQIVNLTLVNL